MLATVCIPTRTLVHRIYPRIHRSLPTPKFPPTFGKLTTRSNLSPVLIFLATRVSVYKSQVLRCTEPFPSSNASRGHTSSLSPSTGLPKSLRGYRPSDLWVSGNGSSDWAHRCEKNIFPQVSYSQGHGSLILLAPDSELREVCDH